MKDSPFGWEWTTLGEVCEKSQYGWTTKAKHDTGNLKLLRTTDITSGHVNWSSVPFCSEEPEDVEKYLVKSGDILISRAGSVGVSFLINNPEYAVFASYLIRFRPREVVDTKYCYYFLKSPDYWAAIGESKAGVAVQNVNASKLSEVSIPLAPLNEQTRIVAEIEKQFSRLDEAVANLKRVKANLKRYKAAVLKAAVEGKLTEEWRRQHPDIEPADKLLERILAERRKGVGKGKYKEPVGPETANLPELPVGWVWASVEQLSVLVQYGSSAKTSEDASGIPVLRMGNIVDGVLDWEVLKYLPTNHDEFPTLFLKAGDLLFNRTNSPELVGKSAVYTGGKDPCSFASYLIRVRSSDSYLSPLLAHYINSSYGRQWVKSVVTQQVGQANVNGTKLQALAVPVPPLAEQHQIVAEIERRLSIVAGAEAQVDANLRRADRLRQSILKQAFSGQLVPQDPNDEPARVLLERIRHGVGAIHESPARATRKPKRATHESPLRKTQQPAEPKPAASGDFVCLDDVTAAMLARMQPGREYSRADLADALGLTTGRWNAAIQELKRIGKVRQVGEKRGARYLRK